LTVSSNKSNFLASGNKSEVLGLSPTPHQELLKDNFSTPKST